MKKLAVLFIALVLCTSVFATTAFTVGTGFGVTKNLYGEKDYGHGVDCFVGADFILKNGITIYDDFDYIYVMKNHDGKPEEVDPVAFIKAGAGYTFNVNNLTLMAGFGPDVKITAAEGRYSEEKYAENGNFFSWDYGFNLKMKLTYFYTENCGITFQVIPSFELSKSNSFSTYAALGFTFSN